MKYKLIIFDFDGTLADSFPWFAANINKAAKLFGFKKITAKDHEHLRKLSARQIISFLGISWWKIPLISVYMRKQMNRELSSIRLFDDVENVLSGLRENNLKLAIVSSNSEENIKGLLGPSALHFDYFKCGSSLFGKPKKFGMILKETRFDSHEVLCIGDEIRDIEAARAVAAHAGAVTWGYASAIALKEANPHYLFNSMKDILHVLERR